MVKLVECAYVMVNEKQVYHGDRMTAFVVDVRCKHENVCCMKHLPLKNHCAAI